MDEVFYNKIFHIAPMLPAPTLRSLSGHELPVKGTATIPLLGQEVRMLVCADLGSDLLLGVDALKDTLIDFPSSCLETTQGRYDFEYRALDVCSTGNIPEGATNIPPLLEAICEHLYAQVAEQSLLEPLSVPVPEQETRGHH